MKGNTEEITGIKKISIAKIAMRIRLLKFLFFLFLIQSAIILKIITREPHIIIYLEERILSQAFYSLHTSPQE